MTSFLCFVWHLLEIEGIDIAYVVNDIFIGCKNILWKRNLSGKGTSLSLRLLEVLTGEQLI